MNEQRSPEWFKARKKRVTGSVVGAILGLSPYSTRADAMRAMVRSALGVPSEFTGNAATEWGTAMEPMAIGEFEMETGHSVKPMPFVPYEDWLGASPDGAVSDGQGLEVKCPYGIRNDPHPAFKTLADQPHYYAQVQIEMYVCGWGGLTFYQWTPHSSHTTFVHPDVPWLDENLPKLRQFYAEFLHEMENPEEHLDPRRVTIDTPTAHQMLAEWDQLGEAIELATERRKDLLSEIAALAGERDALIAGRKLTLVKKEGAVSYAKALKALAPDADLSQWKGKPSQHWKLT